MAHTYVGGHLQRPRDAVHTCFPLSSVGCDVDLLRANTDLDVAGRIGGNPRNRRLDRTSDGEFDGRPFAVGGPDLALQQVRRSEEAGNELGRRALIDILRSADLLALAEAHDGEAVGHRHGFFLVVRDVDEGDADLLLDALELQLHLLAQLEIQSTQRLVQEQDLGLVHQRACEGDALHLAAGHLTRLPLLVAGHLHQLQRGPHPAFDVALRDLAPTKAEGHVVEHVEVREQRVGLEDGVDVAAVRGKSRHVLAAQVDGTRGGVLEPADHPQGRGLAAARRAEHREELAGRDIEGKVVDRHDILTEALGDMLQPDIELGHLDGCLPLGCGHPRLWHQRVEMMKAGGGLGETPIGQWLPSRLAELDNGQVSWKNTSLSHYIVVCHRPDENEVRSWQASISSA